MAQFSYKAINSSGKEIRGIINASKEEEVAITLKTNGYFPAEIKLLPAKNNKMENLSNSKWKNNSLLNIQFGSIKMTQKELILFTRQLSILLDAKLPLLRALRILENQAGPRRVKRIIAESANCIENGSAYSEALTKNHKTFDPLYTNMIKAGESTGTMEVMLRKLASFMEKNGRIISRVKSAMIYPLVIMTVAGGVTLFLILFIVPKFEKIFAELLNGMPLPPLTRFVLALSQFFLDSYIQIFSAVAVFVLVYKIASKTKKGKYIFDAARYRMPVLGNLVSKTSIARFSRTLGMLLSSSVPVLKALLIVKDTSENKLLENRVHKIYESVRVGENISSALYATKIFPNMVVSMIEVGEETGKLPEMLEKIADSYEEEVDNALEAMISLIEPVLIVVMAIVVGTIVLSMFMPLIKIMQSLGA